MKSEKLEINNLVFNYADKNVLDDISFKVESGDFVAIVGKSGAGKTSLLKAIAGIYKISHGNIKIFGRDIKKIEYKEFMKMCEDIYKNMNGLNIAWNEG